MRCLFILLITLSFISCNQSQSTRQKVDDLLEVRFDKTLFTSFAWMNIGMYAPGDTSAMDDVGKNVYTMIYRRLDSAQIRSIRDQYISYQETYGRMFDYILSIFSINCTQPPLIEALYDELKAYGDSIGKPDTWSLNRIRELEPLAAELTQFYKEADMEQVARSVQPLYDSIGDAYRKLAVEKLTDAMLFTGVKWEELDRIKKVVIVPNLLGFPGEMGPEYKGVKYDIKGPKSQVVFYTHEFVHSMVHPLLEAPGVKEKINAFVNTEKARIDTTKAWESYAEPVIFFEECLVRALDAHIMNIGKADGPEKIKKYLDFEESRGFIFCHQVSEMLMHYDPSESNLKELVNQIIG